MVLLTLGEQLLWRRPLSCPEIRVRGVNGDTISLGFLARRAIADVGEARPSHSGRECCCSDQESRVILSASEESWWCLCERDGPRSVFPGDDTTGERHCRLRPR